MAVTEAMKNRERFFTLKRNLEDMLKRIAPLEDEVERTAKVTREHARPATQAVTPKMLANFTKFEKGQWNWTFGVTLF